ncbi:MAG TPA: o-succinylbenzoate synthase [Fluviicola sp.]|nr:o-succinylbenzoate synthase [Fluviicola sp.]
MEYRSILGEVPDGLSASFEAHTLLFKQPSGTSRGILTEKKLWLIRIWSETDPSIVGTGECSVIPGLSPDFTSVEQYENELRKMAENPAHFLRNPHLLNNKPSLLFGLETAFLDWENGGKGAFFDTPFSRGERSIPINGLVWMGSEQFMHEQIEQKLLQGFSCIKMKVGAIDFETEIKLLESIRQRYTADQITLRVDANGAFSLQEVDEKLQRLADLEIHSIEQPIAVGQYTELCELCARTPLPIALDEELIPVCESAQRAELLEFVKPQYIILKPSLHGGFSGCLEWIELAKKNNIPWWMTSALESNIGLNAIAQFTATFDPEIPQGLGTGGLYETNFETRLVIENGALFRR